MEKLIITASITGGSSPQGNPYLPNVPHSVCSLETGLTYLTKQKEVKDGSE